MAVDLKKWRQGVPYDVQGTFGEIASDVQAMEGLQATMDAGWKQFWRRIKWLALGLAITVVLLSIVAFPYGMLLLFIGVPGLIAYLLFGIFTTHKDKSLYRADVMRSVLNAVGRDLNHREKLHARLLLKDERLPHKESPIPNRKKGKEKLYRDEWLALEGEFLDGAAWSFGIVQLRRMRFWTNPRGKSKNKSRTQHLCTLRLRYPAERYGEADIPQELVRKAIRLPNRAVCKATRVTPKDLLIRVMVTEQADLIPVGPMMFLSLYKVLNGMRRHKVQGAKG